MSSTPNMEVNKLMQGMTLTVAPLGDGYSIDAIGDSEPEFSLRVENVTDVNMKAVMRDIAGAFILTKQLQKEKAA